MGRRRIQNILLTRLYILFTPPRVKNNIKEIFIIWRVCAVDVHGEVGAVSRGLRLAAFTTFMVLKTFLLFSEVAGGGGGGGWGGWYLTLILE